MVPPDYEAWAIGRSCQAMLPEYIPADSYTHINFAFAFIDPVKFTVASMNPGDADLYRRVTDLKRLYPGLEVWIAIGGWTHNDPDQPTATTFSDLAASPARQRIFHASLVNFMNTYGFDGVDIDWEYPVAEERSGTPQDRANFVSWMANMRSYFASTGRKYGISLTLPASFWYLQHFDIVNLERHIDWFNMMSYDLHGTWDANNVYMGPYVAGHTNLTEIDLALKLLWRNNINPEKVVLGLGFYGRSFQLENPNCKAPGCRFSGPAPGGPCTQSAGTLSYGEIKKLVDSGAGTSVLDNSAAVRILTWNEGGGTHWVSYDDQQTIQMKLDYADRNCLGGKMVWAVSTDDLSGTLSSYLNPGKVASLPPVAMSSVVDVRQQCRWTNCGESCPSGLSPAAISKGGVATSDRQCHDNQVRSFCCPNSFAPTCRWAGSSLKICNDGCKKGEVKVGSSTRGCNLHNEALCCTDTLSTRAHGECQWSGSAPLCTVSPWGEASCPGGKPVKLTTSSMGDGGEKMCTKGSKSYCCQDPYALPLPSLPILPLPSPAGETATAGKAVVAVDPQRGFCLNSRGSAYCCDIDPEPVQPPSDSSSWASMLKIAWPNWVRSRFCDATVGRPQKKRSESSHIGMPILERRLDFNIVSPSNWNIAEFLRYALAQSSPSAAILALRQEWDRLMQSTPGFEYLTIANLMALVSMFDGVDPVYLVAMILCASQQPSNQVRDALDTRSQLCTSTCVDGGTSIFARHDVPIPGPISDDASPLDKRAFNWLPNPRIQAGILPGWGPAIDAINAGQLHLEYWTLFRYAAGLAGRQIELEVVYLLAGDTFVPGQPLMANLQSNPATDNFLILHIHFAGSFQIVTRSGNTVTVPGIQSVNIRHGHRVYQTAQGSFRVESEAQPAGGPHTQLINCDTGNWCPNTVPTHSNLDATRLRTLMSTLSPILASIQQFLPAGVNVVNGNWAGGVRDRGSFARSPTGAYLPPTAYTPPAHYTTANGFLR
ncbi:hypothetical protein OQA88_8423 [Cercophora sp. LCS_1]